MISKIDKLWQAWRQCQLNLEFIISVLHKLRQCACVINLTTMRHHCEMNWNNVFENFVMALFIFEYMPSLHKCNKHVQNNQTIIIQNIFRYILKYRRYSVFIQLYYDNWRHISSPYYNKYMVCCTFPYPWWIYFISHWIRHIL